MFKTGKYVILKERNNYMLVIGIIAMSIIVGILATSKMWLPDDRAIVKVNNDTELIYPMNTVTVGIFEWCQEENLGEIHLIETKINDKSDYDVSYKVYNEAGAELPSKTIKGTKKKETEVSAKSTQDVIVQFGLPTDFYYITIHITQADGTTKEIMCDYRNFEIKKLTEKGDDYLINVEEMEKPVLESESKLSEIKGKIEQKESELKEIQSLSKEEQDKQKDKMNTIQTEISKLKEEMKPIQEKYNEQKKTVDNLRE